MDRYNAVDGGLLAAGIAYNTLFALIPMALFGSGLLGFFVNDPKSMEAVRSALTGWAPPLEGVVNELLDGLSDASPSLSIIGLVGTAWGASRLFAALELGIGAMFVEVPRLGLVARTLRRLASILVVAGVVVGAFVATSIASLVSELGFVGDSALDLVGVVALVVLPVVVIGLAIAIVYRFVPPVRPGLGAIAMPAIVIAIGLVVLSRVFAIVAPRLLGANFVYGTLGAIFVALAWLGSAYSLLLIGAAWVRERMDREDETATVA